MKRRSTKIISSIVSVCLVFFIIYIAIGFNIRSTSTNVPLISIHFQKIKSYYYMALGENCQEINKKTSACPGPKCEMQCDAFESERAQSASGGRFQLGCVLSCQEKP